MSRHYVLHIAAGSFFSDYLESHGVPARNIATLGSLSYALYAEPYRSGCEIPREILARRFSLDPNLPWIFFPENYSAAFFSDYAIEERVKRGFDRETILAYREFARRSLETIGPWCVALARSGCAELIVRPRPATPLNEFAAALERVAGGLPDRPFHVIKDESVREWIFASQVVVSSYSSTLIEAAIGGVPAYLLAPEEIPEVLRAEWCTDAPRIRSAEEFMACVAKAAPATALYRYAQKNLLAAGDPIESLVDLLTPLRSGERQAPPRIQRELVPIPNVDAGRLFRGGWRGNAHRLLDTLLRRKSSTPQEFESDHFTHRDVERRTEHWRQHRP